MSAARLLLASWPGWVLGTALQLQQPALWSARSYVFSLGLALLAFAGALRARERLGRLALPACLLAAAVAAFGLTGWRASHFAAQALDPDLQGQDIRVAGTVSGLPQRGADGLRFVFEVGAAEQAGRPLRLPPRLQLGWYRYGQGAAPELLHAGERWQFTVRLRSPHGSFNPQGFDRERWLWENGIGATGYVRDGPHDPPPQRLAVAGWALDAVREAVGERIRMRVDDPRTAGVLAALVVGDQSAIDSQGWALFRTTGVAHLMSISGLHVTLFAWLATQLIAALWRRLARPWPALLLALPRPQAAGVGGVMAALAYAQFAGWGVPAQRTVLMLALVVGLRLLGRQWPWPALWGTAMVAVLLLDPWALLQPGFWLSFVAVAILFAADPAQRPAVERAAAGSPSRSRWRRAGLAVGSLWREQLVVTVALTPLSLLLFGQVSLVGLVANLLAIPWVTLVVTPLALAGALAAPLWTLAALAVQVLDAGLLWLAQGSWAALYRPIPPLPLALAGVAGATLLVLRLPAIVRAAGVLLLVPVLVWQPARPAPGAFEVMAIDVGQGSAVLVRTAGHSLLYDAGPRYGRESDAGQRVVVPLLHALGEAPEVVVISHRDSDHAGGAEAVAAAWPQARWLSSYDADPMRRCQAGQGWTWDGVRFDILHPASALYRPDGSSDLSTNAMSCVLRIHSAQRSAWLSGDLDAERETWLAQAQPELRADLLVAPHHGSSSSSSPVLLNTLQPSVVLIQSGYRNRFHHPAAQVLDRYRERGLRWTNSPQCGAASWRSDDSLVVRCERVQSRRYWHHEGADCLLSAADEPEDGAEAPAD